MIVNERITADSLLPGIQRLWGVSAGKLVSIHDTFSPNQGAPVYTVNGKYTTRGWTEWTEGFLYGSSVLQYDATRETDFLDLARSKVVAQMASHVSHVGVHDHGFNNLSTYGNLLRLMMEGNIPFDTWEKHFYELAIKLSGAIQARRWTEIPAGGYIYSFNGPHSLFVDTLRTLRIVVVAHLMRHTLMDENDRKVNLLHRAISHALTTAQYNIYYGEGRDHYDEWGRTAHEAIFNINDGRFRCPNAQQGFSGFTTWTRGLSWAMLGYAEQLEILFRLPDYEFELWGGKDKVRSIYLKAAQATCDFYLANTAADGIPYWDTGAPLLHKLGDYRSKASDPYNSYEPVDSSAAAIAAQGLIRLGLYMGEQGRRYYQAGLTVLNTLLEEPYLSVDPSHQGLLLHSIYHRPNGWDHIQTGRQVPSEESSMWGDYHLRELALFVQRLAYHQDYYRFDGCIPL